LIELPVIRGGKETYTIERKEIDDVTGRKLVSVSSGFSFFNIEHERLLNAFKDFQNLHIKDLIEKINEVGKFFEKRKINYEINLTEFAKYIALNTGMPIKYVLQSYDLIAKSCKNIEEILSFQSPNGKIEAYDVHIIKRNKHTFGWVPQVRDVYVIMPSNHPAVDTLILFVIGSKIPCAVRPSYQDLFTPYLITKALCEAGLKDCISYIPSDHAVALEAAAQFDSTIVFGTENTIKQFSRLKNVKGYGPGRSKLIVDQKLIEEYADYIAFTALDSSGRGCINTSGIIVIGDCENLCTILKEAFDKIELKDILDESATIGAVKKAFGETISNYLMNQISIENAKKWTESEILDTLEGYTYLRPTIVEVRNDSKLLGREFLFPFITVTSVKDDEIAARLAQNSLQVIALTESSTLQKKLVSDRTIEKVYIGPLREIDFISPHEGFITDFLYKNKGVKYAR